MFGIKFIKVQPTTYLLQYRGGKVVREGLGLSFFYYSPTTSLVAVPVGSADVPFIFQETTSDWGKPVFRLTASSQLAESLAWGRVELNATGRAHKRRRDQAGAEWRLPSLVTKSRVGRKLFLREKAENSQVFGTQ